MENKPLPEASFPRIASFRSAALLAAHLKQLGFDFPWDESILPAPASPLAQPCRLPWGDGWRDVGNRFAVQPMEGWDGERDGRPSELTARRWLRFGRSGAKLLWGCEAVAVLPEARANPHQLLLDEDTAPAFRELRRQVLKAHHARFGASRDLIVGLQLTHSGRFSRPHEESKLEPVILYHHPVLDAQYPACAGVEPISDAEVIRIVEAFGRAARLAQEAGFDFVDLKACHGYLGHEFLSAYHRPGRYGGSFENRMRFLRELIAITRESAPGLEVGVRFSAYDSIPYSRDPRTGQGIPAQDENLLPYTWGFGVNPWRPTLPDLAEAKLLLNLLRSLHVRIVNISASSPYYGAHVQRPALFPPCDAYFPPEDPLAGAARMLAAGAELKKYAPDMVFVSTGWTYFQDYLPHFAQAQVRAGRADFIGLGRMMIAYPEFPADVLEKGRIERKEICRTFSDCTSAPRCGLISGCYPLDPFYKERPEAKQLRIIKAGLTLRKSPA